MSAQSPMLSFEEARARMLSLALPSMTKEHVELDEAQGRVLAEDLRASVDMPAFDYSAMDGYAVRAADTELTASPLVVRGESRTGAVPGAHTSGTAVRIFTGAGLPAGADAVVMQENAQRDGEKVTFSRPVRAGENVRRRGEDLAAGALALSSGTRLHAPHLSLCAALDRARVLVSVRPSVAIIATGDELRRPGSEARAGTIAESNTVALRAMARHAGANAHVLPYVRDERSAIEAAFAAALAQSDVVVTVGGVSVGDHDLVRPALVAVGVTLDFWRVAIKPGKPLAVGRLARSGKRDAIVVGVPGNPSSAMVTFALFGMPLLRAMQGDAQPLPVYLRARVTHAHAHAPGRLEFVRATLSRSSDGSTVATALPNQASGAATTIAHANALMLVPADSTGLAQGDEVDVLPMAELGG